MNQQCRLSFLSRPGVVYQSLKSCLVLLLSPHDNSSFNAILIYQGNLGLATTPQPAKPTPTPSRPLKINPQCLPSPPSPLFFLQPDPISQAKAVSPPVRAGAGAMTKRVAWFRHKHMQMIRAVAQTATKGELTNKITRGTTWESNPDGMGTKKKTKGKTRGKVETTQAVGRNGYGEAVPCNRN